MIKLIITDLDGTFLDEKGDYNREMFQDVKKIMVQKGVHFAICTGKQCERVEELFKGDAEQFWILGDSATRIKYKGEYVYQSLIKNQLGLNIITKLEAINKEP
ncbi:HAD hydrolase family protein, partial [Yersinia enterocolitica]